MIADGQSAIALLVLTLFISNFRNYLHFLPKFDRLHLFCCILLPGITLLNSALHCAVLDCIVLYFVVLYFIVSLMHGTVSCHIVSP